jgi:hypothetical protein
MWWLLGFFGQIGVAARPNPIYQKIASLKKKAAVILEL